MARRIGERLLGEGLIDAEQLDQALRSQVIHGGRLGTNLIEYGALDLDGLAEALARQHGVPPALQRHFDRSDPALQARLTPELAARWHAIPLRFDKAGERIAVATTDPLGAEAIAELEAALGAPVIPAIAAELRILYQLEWAYGVDRLNRFLRVAPSDPAEWARQSTENERRRFVPTLSGQEPVATPGALARIAVKQITPGREPAEEPAEPLDEVDVGLAAMRQATDRDRIGDLLVQTLEDAFGGALDAAMILILRNGVAIGWKGFVRGGDSGAPLAVAIPVSDQGVLREPYQARTAHFGPPAGGGSPLDQRLWRHLGTGPPAEVAVVPIELFDEIPCIIYAQSAAEIAPGTAGGIAELAQGLSAAFHRLVRAAER